MAAHLPTSNHPHTAPALPDYEILAEQSRESASILFHARHLPSGQLCGLRCMLRSAWPDDARWREFVGFARSLVDQQQRLAVQPNIQNILDCGETEELFYFATPTAAAQTLGQWLAREAPMPLERIAPLFAQMAAALDFIASFQLAHSGLTPETILIAEPDDRILVCDYTLTKLRPRMITAYTAPEQLATGHCDSRGDIYAMGALLHACVTGAPPFTARTQDALVRDITTSLPVLPDQPLFVRDVLTKLMRKFPENRYRVAVDAIEDLKHQRSPSGNLAVDEKVIPQIIGAVPEIWDLPAFAVVETDAGASKANASGRAAARIDVGDAVHRLLSRIQDVFVGLVPARLRTKPLPADSADAPGRYARRDTPAWLQRLTALGGLCWRITRIAVPLMLIALVVHACYLANRQRYAVVKEISGRPMVVIGNSRTPLNVGDKLDAARLPVVATDSRSSVVLETVGARIKLTPGSSLQVRRLAFDGGRRRQFDLRKGQAIVCVDPQQGAAGRFDLTCGPIRTRVHGTEFSVSATGAGAVVRVVRGVVAVTDGPSRKAVSTGQEVRGENGVGLPDPTKLTAREIEALHTQVDSLLNRASTEEWNGKIEEFQERTLLPYADKLLALAHIQAPENGPLADAKAIATARISLEAIHKGLMLNGEPLASLNPTTLDELGLEEKDAKRILASFEDHRLLAFYRLHDESYVLFARATDSNHTLFRESAGQVTAIAEENEDKAFADANKRRRR